MENAMPSNRLQDERAACALPMEGIRKVFLGDSEEQARRQRALDLLAQDPLLGDSDGKHYGLSIPEQRKRAQAQLRRYYELQNNDETRDIATEILHLAAQADRSWAVCLGVSRALFGETLRTQGSDELIAAIYPSILDGSTVGCFCMTELGTGSYIQDFETTATYQCDKQEFIIDSPSLTATKWWIGAAASSASWAVVFARLLVKDADHGTHVFLVRLRDEQMQVMPNIEIGDVGPKRGWNGVDNGYVRFKQLRIPHAQMLSRWSRVDEDGNYSSAAIPQLAYAALLAGRVSVVQQALATSKCALTIATRFCIVRDQHSIKGKCLMDYQVQQERLLSRVCSCYAYHFAAKHLQQRHSLAMAELDEGKIDKLKSVHGLAAGLKGSLALWTADTLHACTLAMGGHAYSAFSGLPDRIADWAVLIPGEGDALVMLQQAARHLVQCLEEGGQAADPELSYLAEPLQTALDGELNIDELENALRWLAQRSLQEAYRDLQASLQEHPSPKEAWNSCQLILAEAAGRHIAYRAALLFKEAIDDELGECLGKDKAVWVPQLEKLRECFLLTTLRDNLVFLLEHGYLSHGQAKQLRKRIFALYAELRCVLVALVDAWGVSDFELASALGRFDGELYEAYFRTVKQHPLNR